MLNQLRISNFALIRELEFSPSKSLTIITGETGAGKSIMLGAVGLLLGQRADTKVLYDPSKKCVIEGEFVISDYNLKNFFSSSDLDYDTTCLLRREISPAGKTRAFINDTPVTLDIMQELGNKLMDIHSQHDTLLLRSTDFQLEVVDSYSESSKALTDYQDAYGNFRSATKKLLELEEQSAKLSEEFDYLSFQREELKKANLEENEQSELEEKVKVLENAEEIKSILNQIINLTEGSDVASLFQLKEATRLLKSLSKFSERYEKLSGRIESISIDLQELAKDIEREEEEVDFDPQHSRELKERLSLIYHLQQKHRVSTIRELLDILATLEEKVGKATGMNEVIDNARKDREKWNSLMLEKGKVLSEIRRKGLAGLQKEATGYLKELGMPDGILKIEMKDSRPSSQGLDEIIFYFSANKGIQPRELKQVASGGEFSRLMFCLKFILAGKSKLPTMVFDEIDNGISGEIALKLGNMMKLMARDHQVITISHLPQIAAKGNSHFIVFKDNVKGKAASRIRKLSEEERVEEVAKMIAGENPTRNAFESARELIAS